MNTQHFPQGDPAKAEALDMMLSLQAQLAEEERANAYQEFRMSGGTFSERLHATMFPGMPFIPEDEERAV